MLKLKRLSRNFLIFVYRTYSYLLERIFVTVPKWGNVARVLELILPSSTRTEDKNMLFCSGSSSNDNLSLLKGETLVVRDSRKIFILFMDIFVHLMTSTKGKTDINDSANFIATSVASYNAAMQTKYSLPISTWWVLSINH